MTRRLETHDRNCKGDYAVWSPRFSMSKFDPRLAELLNLLEKRFCNLQGIMNKIVLDYSIRNIINPEITNNPNISIEDSYKKCYEVMSAVMGCLYLIKQITQLRIDRKLLNEIDDYESQYDLTICYTKIKNIINTVITHNKNKINRFSKMNREIIYLTNKELEDLDDDISSFMLDAFGIIYLLKEAVVYPQNMQSPFALCKKVNLILADLEKYLVYDNGNMAHKLRNTP